MDESENFEDVDNKTASKNLIFTASRQFVLSQSLKNKPKLNPRFTTGSLQNLLKHVQNQ